MSIKTLILGAAALAGLALPGVASAQAYGWGGGYGGGDQRGYGSSVYGGRDDGYDYRDDRRGRWEQRRHWQEVQRRRAWAHAHRHHGRFDDRDDDDRDYRGY